MKKITPKMLGVKAKAIKLPKYDWEKQSRVDAFGTFATTNNSYWTNSQFGKSLDSSFDSIND